MLGGNQTPCFALAEPATIREMPDIEIEGDMIRLGQLLKLSALAESGADARELLLASVVTVNGDPEARRGRQLHRGDVVAVGEQTVRVV
jgi:ribosome-associated protein